MPYIEPSRSDVHVSRPLSQVSLAFNQDAENFVAGTVFPLVQSSHQANLYYTYDRGDFNRDEMRERAPSTESAGGTYAVGNDNFFCRVRAFHRDIDDQVRSNADDPFDLDREATRFVTLKHLLNREVRFAVNYFTAGDPGDTWTFDVDGAATASLPAAFDPTDAANNQKLFWDDAASTPIEDIRQGKRFVLGETGFNPNMLTVGRTVFDTLLDHPDLVGRMDRGQTAGAARVNRAAMAELFEVDKVNVMDAIQNTAAKGQTAVHSFIGGNHALLSYAPASPGIMTPTAGYTFAWTGYTGATEDGSRILRFRMDELKSDRVEIESADDQKLVAADLGYFFGGIVQ